jgi:hypothetical protein
MARLIFKILINCLLIALSIKAYAHPIRDLYKNKNFSHEGHIFFNATNSATQGERYLLNQQLSNIKLGSELKLTDWNKLKALLIYNTLPTPIAPSLYFEQLYDKFEINFTNLFIDIGRKWLPFGTYKNDLIYKPLTKALGQTNEVTTVLGYDSTFYANAALFEPYSRIKNSSFPLYYNFNIGVHEQSYDIGASFLRSFADTQLFQYNKGFGGFLSQSLKSDVPGGAVYINLQHKKWTAYVTYVEALRPFAIEDMSYNKKGARPKALSIQSGYDLYFKNTPVKVTGFYDYSFQALALRLPKKRVGIGFSVNPVRYLSLQFQYFKDYGYPSHTVATGLDRFVWGNPLKVNNFALQAIVNF